MATPTTSRLLLVPSGLSSRTSSQWPRSTLRLGRQPSPRLRCSSPPVDAAGEPGKGGEYRPSFAKDFLLAFFRSKMVEEVGWDSEKPGYAGLIEVANRLMIKGKSALETEQSAVRVLQSLFPPVLLVLFKALLPPIANGQLAAVMVARATALSCQRLMGPCSVNSVTLPDGKYWSSGVFVEKCKYLEESKCLGICVNTCKLPTQFNFGVRPPPLDTDKALKEPCLDICTNARRRRELGRNSSPDELSCPQV